MVVAKSVSTLITKVWGKNFKSIEYAELELDSLTVLVGPNASGKSNLMDLLKFVQDAANKGLELAIGNRGGIESVARRSPNGVAEEVEIGISIRSPVTSFDYSFALTNRRNRDYGLLRETMNLETRGRQHDVRLDVALERGTLRTSNLTFSEIPPGSPNESKETVLSNAEFSRWSIDEDFGDQNLVLISNQTVIRRGFLPAPVRTAARREDPHYVPIPFAVCSAVDAALSSCVDHLNAMSFYRIFPNSLREPQKMVESNPLSEDGSNLASAIQAMERRDNSLLPELRDTLHCVVPGITNVKVSPAGSYLVVELEHDKTERGELTGWFDLSAESDGTLRLLGLLVAFFQQPPPSLFAVEEPEMNVHPGAMATLVETMEEATERGQVLVTTHSPDLIDLLPIERIRAVTVDDGSTRVGRVAEHQLETIREALFTPGQLHSMEGLQIGIGEVTEVQT